MNQEAPQWRLYKHFSNPRSHLCELKKKKNFFQLLKNEDLNFTKLRKFLNYQQALEYTNHDYN